MLEGPGAAGTVVRLGRRDPRVLLVVHHVNILRDYTVFERASTKARRSSRSAASSSFLEAWPSASTARDIIESETPSSWATSIMFRVPPAARNVRSAFSALGFRVLSISSRT